MPTQLPDISARTAVRPTSPAILAALILIAAADALADRDTLRCGSKIVRVGATSAEVLEQCGEPSTRSVEDVPVHSGGRVTGTTTMQTWVYDRGTGQKPATLTFDRDRLVSIDY